MNKEHADETQPLWNVGRKLLVIGLCVAVIAVVGAFLRAYAVKEPTYNGKPLSYWLARAEKAGFFIGSSKDTNDVESREAIRRIGTNAIPALLKMLRAKDSPVKLKLLDFIERWDSEYYSKLSGSMAQDKHHQAFVGFLCLQDIATNAIPAVVDIYNQASDPSWKDYADSALKAIYPASGTATAYWLPLKRREQWFIETAEFKARVDDQSNAILAYSEAIRLNPTNTAAYRDRASVKFQSKDFNGGLSDAAKALELDGSNQPALYTKALCEFALKDFKSAEADFTARLNSITNHAYTYNLRGLARANLRKLDEAFADFDTAISQEPENAEFLRNRGAVEGLHEDYESAMVDLSQSITLENKDPMAYSFRGNVNNLLKDHQAALADFNKSIELNPKDAGAYSGRGTTKMYLGQFEAAEADLKKSLELDPKIPTAYLARGHLKAKQGRKENEVLPEVERVVELGPPRPETILMVGWFQYHYLHRENALENFRKALEPPPLRAEGEARAYIWLIKAQAGHAAAANGDLEDYLRSLKGPKTNEWDASLARFLCGRLTESNFLALATTTAKHPSAIKGQVCESFYYAGMKRKISGDRAGALELFQKCVDTKQDNNLSYLDARDELGSITIH